MSDFVQLEFGLEQPRVTLRVLATEFGPSGECEVLDISAAWVKVKMPSAAGGVWVKWEAVHPEDRDKLQQAWKRKKKLPEG